MPASPTTIQYGDSPPAPIDGALFVDAALADLQVAQGGTWLAIGIRTFRAAVRVASTVATTAGGALGLRFGPATGPGIYWGSGAPTVSAPQGSLYIRTDGSSTSTRAYVNTDAATTWTAITTAA